MASKIECLGKVLEIEKDSILIHVLVTVKPKILQARRFPMEPFEEMELKKNDVINISITTKPGLVTHEYVKLSSTAKIEKLFMPVDYFKNIDTSFLSDD